MIKTNLIEPINKILLKQAKVQNKKIAFSDFNSEINYYELERKTLNLASNILSLGLSKGDAVALILPNSVEWVIAFLGTLRAGLTIVPISFDSTTEEINYKLHDSNTKFVITSTINQKILESLKSFPNLDKFTCFTDSSVEGNNLSFNHLCLVNNKNIKINDDDINAPNQIIYTSGTTGKPKGVLLTTRSMLWVVASCWVPIVNLNSKDKVLSPLPLFHSYAINFSILSIIASGCSEFILEKFSPSIVLDLLNSKDFTVLPGVPTMFHYLLETAKQNKISNLGSITRCVSAGAIMPATLNSEYELYFNNLLLDGYGITETSTMVTMNWKSNRKIGSCGIPIPGMSVRIISSQNVEAGPNEEGELICYGPNLMVGYHNKEDETKKVIKDKWYYTGDLAKRDNDGFITITGRLKELIIRGGQNISPAEIEEAILKDDQILDCAIVGKNHDTLGEVPIAFIVLKNKNKFDKETLSQICKINLSKYKIPEDFKVVDNIPRTGSGKIMRYQLKIQK